MSDVGSKEGTFNNPRISKVTDKLSATHLNDGGDDCFGSGEADGSYGHPKSTIDAEDPELWEPHPETEDCPVCMVPLPLDREESLYWTCCGKTICRACEFEQGRALELLNVKRINKDQPPLEPACAFCRASKLIEDEDVIRSYKEKARNGDAVAAHNLATFYTHGNYGVEINEAKALELLQYAANLGNRDSMVRLAIVYHFGELGENESINKAKEYANEAINKGKVSAHTLLAVFQLGEGHIELATRHWCLAAEAGEVESMKLLWDQFYRGELSKDQLERTLRRHKETLDEMNSEDRERWRGWKKAEVGGDRALVHIYFRYYHGRINAKELKELIKLHKKGLARGKQ